MRLFEKYSDQLPKRFGMVTVNYDDKIREPIRNKDRITLPYKKENEIFSLKRNQQFLFNCPIGNYFGGTDENPFLVRLNSMQGMIDEGEKGFFESLIPDTISSLASDLNTKIKRQGDWLTVKLPWSWNTLKLALKVVNDFEFKFNTFTNTKIKETRHTLTGVCLSKMASIMGYDNCSIIEGTLEAPDHEPLILVGPHVIEQATNLFDPKNAD